MSKDAFFSELKVQRRDSGTWVLQHPMIFHCDDRTDIVPANFSTDFASVPRVPFVFWLFANTTYKAATLHDFLYSSANVARGVADHRFLRAMEVEGVPAWRRYPIFLAVRLFGGFVRRDAYGITY